jgi:mRNA interferase RelE/StbE
MNHPYRVETTPTFERDFKKLDKTIARRVSKKMFHLARHPELGLPLRNMPEDLAGIRKFRIGDYRVLYWADHALRVLKLYAVGHRSNVYQGL